MEPKDWVVFLLGLLTFGIGGMNAWLTVRTRSSIHRDLLYKKQFDAYEKIHELTTPLYFDCMKALGIALRESNGNKQEFQKHYEQNFSNTERIHALLTELMKSIFYLPDEVQVPFFQFFQLLQKIHLDPKYDNLEIHEKSMQMIADLGKPLFQAQLATRKAVGVEALNAEIQRIIRVSHLT